MPQTDLETVPHRVRTPDGVTLSGHLVRPTDPHTVHTIALLRTPYDASRHLDQARAFARRGYACLVQDVRGRYGSEGTWEPYRHEGRDGATSLDALGAEFPGKPALLLGASYAAHAALALLDARGPAGIARLLLLVPALGAAETAWLPDGTPRYRERIGWWHEHGRGKYSTRGLGPAALASRTLDVLRSGPARAAGDWGWDRHTVAQWRRLWADSSRDAAQRYARHRVPLAIVTGQRDFFDADARDLAQRWAGPSLLLSGPWGHGLAADLPTDQRAAFQANGGIMRPLDEWLNTPPAALPRRAHHELCRAPAAAHKPHTPGDLAC